MGDVNDTSPDDQNIEIKDGIKQDEPEKQEEDETKKFSLAWLVYMVAIMIGVVVIIGTALLMSVTGVVCLTGTGTFIL